MCRRSRAFTLVEFLFVLAILVILLFAVPWTFRGFAGLWFLLGVLTWLAVVAAVNKGRIAFGIAMIPVIGCLIWICTILPTVYPMRFARLRGTTYEDQPLASVLSDISGQKDGYPSWRFVVSELDLAQQLVSVEIPDGWSAGLLAANTIGTGTKGAVMPPVPNAQCFASARLAGIAKSPLTPKLSSMLRALTISQGNR